MSDLQSIRTGKTGNTPDKENRYIITALEDGLIVLRTMMENMSPYHSYSIADLGSKLRHINQNKLFRIIKTLMKHGFVEQDNEHKKRYRIGHPLLYLSHKYFRAIEREQNRIRNEVNSFKIDLY